MGPDRHAQLDHFGIVFPFPLRLALILVAGFWGWGINLHYLYKNNIDVPALIRYPPRQTPSQAPHHTSAYRLATLLTVPLLICFLVFWMVTRRDPERVEFYDYIAQSYLFLFVLLLVFPFHRLANSGRQRFLATLRRISIGGLAETNDGKFADILLADALTSYAKVLGDLYVCFCMFFSRNTSSTAKPDRNCGDYVISLVIALPSLMRFRQCLIEYVRVRRAHPRGENRGGQHLANALKYASAFPPIFLAAQLRNYNPFNSYGLSEIALSRLFFFFSFINAAYSFYWDVTMDWDFTLLTPSRDDPGQPYGLRRHLYFPSERLYYAVISTDFILRFTWLCRFMPGVTMPSRESGIFILNFLEAMRRWIWIFFRVEAEWNRNNHGSAPDDILLGEFKVPSGTRNE